VLQGILEELRKVDRLADFGYLNERILAPRWPMQRSASSLLRPGGGGIADHARTASPKPRLGGCNA